MGWGGGWDQVNRWLNLGKWAHAYLLAGPETGGQEAAADHFAAGILCEHDEQRPCGQCASCRRLAHGNHPGFVRVRPEGSHVKLEQVQRLQQRFYLRAAEGQHRVCVVHGADRMTPEAANAFLKFLEDPVPGVVGILTANRLEGVLPTVRSRCQTVLFSHAGPDILREYWIRRGTGEEKARLFAYLNVAPEDEGNGGAAGPESASDADRPSRCVRFAEIAEWVVEWVQAVEGRQGNPMLDLLIRVGREKWSETECEWLLDVLACWYRDVLYTSLGLSDEVVFVDHRRELSSQAAHHASITAVTGKLQDVIAAKRRLQVHANPQLALECMALRLQGE
ncbi:MAG: DNA polymerase III subunit delta' [Kyrpidia sp.]|nr:DNA polymerase III subunit delta' [Kyrpidia sp.]